MKIFKKNYVIKSIIPTNQNELIIELSNSQYLIVKTELMYKNGYNFLAYPNQLKAFTYNEQQITWKNKKSISLNEIKLFSKKTSFKRLKNKLLTINYKNQAPTKKHIAHHEYSICLSPFTKQILLGESIAGGHAECGGSITLSIAELFNYENWENHFILADCEWATQIIKSNKDNEDIIFNQIINEICSRSRFNNN